MASTALAEKSKRRNISGMAASAYRSVGSINQAAA